ncbi:MAG: hypothetical protein ACP5I8_14885 [Phycisphaerae bacterium]
MGMLQEVHGKKLGVSKLLALSALAALAIAGISQTTHAALVASDNAGNYTSGQWTGSNTAYDQGTGFQTWRISQSGTSGLFLANPSDNKGGPNDIVPPSGSNIWGVYANANNNNGGSIQIDRSFTNAADTGVGKLDPGETFSIALSSDGVSNGGAIGFNLQSSGSTSGYLFQMIFAGGSSYMQINDGSVSTPYTLSSVPFSDFGTLSGDNGGIVANITIGSAVAGGGYNYSLTVTNAAGTTTYQTVSGRQTSAGAINQFQVFDSNAGSNLYFNNIAVAVPTPATAGLVLAGGIGLAAVLLNNRRRFGRKTQPV